MLVLLETFIEFEGLFFHLPYVFMKPSLASPAAVSVVDVEYGATEYKQTDSSTWMEWCIQTDRLH